MHTRKLDVYDPLEDFEPRKLTFDNITKMVHVSGTGPAVIVIPEVPGISPHVARFARGGRRRRRGRVHDAGVPGRRA